MACTCEPMVSQEAEIEESSRSRTNLPAGQSGAEARETQNKTKWNQVKEENWLGKVSLWPPVQFWGKWFHMQSQHKENKIYMQIHTLLMQTGILGGFQSLFYPNSSEGFRRSACLLACRAQRQPISSSLYQSKSCVSSLHFICCCTHLKGLRRYLHCTHG